MTKSPLRLDLVVDVKDAGAQRPKVLVVDDDDNNLLAIETVIEDLAEVVRARSGEEALRHLLREDFAVILLDVFMPGIDGYETAHLVRQREQSKRIPIIFLTAINRDADHMQQGYAMGAVDYVIKPFEPLALRSKVAVFVDLFEMTRQIREKAVQEQRLLDENLRIEQDKVAALEALRQSEERQALILKSLPIALFLETTNVEPRAPHFVSGNLHALTGFDEEWLRVSPGLWTERIHPLDQERVSAARTTLKRTGSLSIEYRWQAADGTYRHFLEQAARVNCDKEEAPEFAGTLLDVTERRQLELQLAQSQKIESIGQLTGGVAHDFNNLLAAVLGGLNLIERKTPATPDVTRLIEMTKHAAVQGTDLIKRLLAFSRRQDLSPQEIDFENFKTATLDLLSHTLGGLVRITWTNAPGIWSVFADRNQLELAIVNLAVNARDAMPEGGLIEISTMNRTLDIAGDTGLVPGDYVVVSVSDNGCGIPKADLERIIEPFYTTKPVGKGTGLGLSMAYGFAQQSSGMLRIESAVDKGTRIDIWLPRSSGSAVSPAASVPVEAPGNSPMINREQSKTTLSVLLVDDHEQVRVTTAEILRIRGHEVLEAAGGAEALAILEKDQKTVDIVLTDYAMPLVSGLELIKIARKSRPGLRAVIMTGYADLKLLDGRPADVSVLAKPVRDDDLFDALEL